MGKTIFQLWDRFQTVSSGKFVYDLLTTKKTNQPSLENTLTSAKTPAPNSEEPRTDAPGDYLIELAKEIPAATYVKLTEASNYIDEKIANAKKEIGLTPRKDIPPNQLADKTSPLVGLAVWTAYAAGFIVDKAIFSPLNSAYKMAQVAHFESNNINYYARTVSSGLSVIEKHPVQTPKSPATTPNPFEQFLEDEKTADCKANRPLTTTIMHYATKTADTLLTPAVKNACKVGALNYMGKSFTVEQLDGERAIVPNQ